jgi:integrase
MATFRKLPSNKWQAIVRRKGVASISNTFSTKLDADKWARQIEIQLDQGTYNLQPKKQEITVSDAIDRFAKEVTPLKKGAAQEFRRLKYLRSIFGKYLLNELKSQHLAQHRDARLKAGISGQTIIHELNILSRVFNIARTEWGYDVDNPVSRITKPKKPLGRNRRINSQELEKILLYLSAEMKTIVLLAIETGMRRSELLSIHWININLANKTIFLPTSKNGHPREIPLSKAATQILEGVYRKENKLFGLTESTVTHSFQRAVKSASLSDLRFHDLRHEATSRFFELGLNTMEVSTITGHKSLAMLARYTHLRAADLALKL